MKSEDTIAKKIVEVLDAGARSVDASTASRLADARRRAVSAMSPPQVAQVSPVVAGWGRVVEFSHHGGYRFWLPLLVLLAALAMALGSSMGIRNDRPIDADALLLASELPPEAYADKEFVAWLEQSSHL